MALKTAIEKLKIQLKFDDERHKQRETTNIYNTIENKRIIKIEKLSKQLNNKRQTAERKWWFTVCSTDISLL